MMPKGVEHMSSGVMNDHYAVVRIPMMPKGVEHWPLANSRAEDLEVQNSDDAERR